MNLLIVCVVMHTVPKTHHFYSVKLFSVSPEPLRQHFIIPIGAKPLSYIYAKKIIFKVKKN
jgi:hypothetical protein